MDATGGWRGIGEGPTDSLAETAYRQIEEMIVTRALPPGTMISENQMSEHLGCGRTPIREALQRLKLEGYVEIHPRRGALVSSIDVRRQLELIEVRRSLEDLAVRLAAERAGEADRERMRALAAEIRDAARQRDRRRYLLANRAIHEIYAQATGNGVLAKTLGPIYGLSRRFWYAHIEDTDSFDEAADLHAAILEAIADRNPGAAADAAARFHRYLETITRRAIAHIL
jgi:DNA-binding GntR family transcriptional regulator